MSDTWGLAGGDQIAPGLTAVRPVGGGDVYEAWLAFDERLYAPVVAKVVRPGHVDAGSSRAALVREVEMLSRVSHPGIARLFSYDDEGPRPYLVLENVDGPTLSSLISTHGYLPLHQLLPLGLELCSALHYLRQQDVCHLDLKPSNVIMGAPAKLIDFSVAMDAQEAAGLTDPVGSDEYMAPEQCRPGVLGTVGHASDMWAFGATMFRAAAGYRAYDREPRWAQLDQTPFDLPHVVPTVLGDLIVSCLAPDAADRPGPAAVAEALEPLLARLPQARLSGFKVRL
ncbi:serine/threonine-protein kinase [Aeromicrobium chenweiae]|uniref:Serine/threonine protein kinase n=1 Tax=Aeromicrobium chenweiae TaxID=2079793 RepID=A0A2S0WN47_9ACTN|nr:serine/threonine-protein kinase [Aeromicrobium chenweiae]AWB92755.1 serine/threonine protein kinase [Aeromicrobium chenweiae]TGN33747.1 serine/threonine protein kinase [Aeromicrobium chenweiae]